jgi:diaminohydroxyphosphoribosylaminopyrimidine deaminase/5-amino-6-(5-phosphoribosylamino)uracil reductase
MDRALQLALQGQGLVEPNPMVGCVMVRDGRCVADGYHARFGGPHAEVQAHEALCKVTPSYRESLSGITVYVTLEPCCHQGKTPPCAPWLCRLKPDRVVIATQDPFPQVAGGGIALLKATGIAVEIGVLQEKAQDLLAPYLKRINTNLPWVIAKWGMTMDGKIATKTGNSQWISSPQSRQRVHELRSRMDAIVVGIGSVLTDNPRLTARLPDGLLPSRCARRVVMDSAARLPLESHLCQSAAQGPPVLVWCGPTAPTQRVQMLVERGCQVVASSHAEHLSSLLECLHYLAQQGATNILVEGGSQVLGTLMDGDQIDECHVFMAPLLLGGRDAISPISGKGVDLVEKARRFRFVHTAAVGNDVYTLARRSLDRSP